MFFRSKKPRLSLAQTLSAKPVRLVEGAMTEREDGGGNLKVPMKQMRWAGWLLRVPDGASKTFELDEMGRFVWDSIDGKTSVQQMIRRLSKRYNINLREAQVSITQFLNMLTRKGLIGMHVKEAARQAGKAKDAKAAG